MKPITTQEAPQAIGPYSQAMVRGDLIFTSGQIPMTKTGELVQGDITTQTEQVLNNLITVLQAADSSLDHVIKTTLFIQDMEQFAEINAVYERFFGNHRPARSCVEVSRLPKDVGIEMEVIAQKQS